MSTEGQLQKVSNVDGLYLHKIDVKDIEIPTRLLFADRLNKYLDFAERQNRNIVANRTMSKFLILGIHHIDAKNNKFTFNEMSNKLSFENHPLLNKISDMISENYNDLNLNIENFKNANIIIRKYETAGIGYHKDDMELFEPIVFTLVLKCTGSENGCLSFKSDKNEINFTVPEENGTLIIMKDESLTKFTHGIKPPKKKDNVSRISITVRFFKEEKLTKLEGYDSSKKMFNFESITYRKILEKCRKQISKIENSEMKLDNNKNDSQTSMSSCRSSNEEFNKNGIISCKHIPEVLSFKNLPESLRDSPGLQKMISSRLLPNFFPNSTKETILNPVIMPAHNFLNMCA